MKIVQNYIAVVFTLLNSMLLALAQEIQKDKSEVPVAGGLYLGQKPPGKTPELFAPGIISSQDYFEHSAAMFSPDKREVYWAAKPNGQRNLRIYFMKMIDGIWTERQVAPFSRTDYNFDNPALSTDGNKLYFSSDMPIPPGRERNDWNIWVVERNGNHWSEPSLVSTEINSAASERAPCATKDGSLYFSRMDGRREDIFVSRFNNGEFIEPLKLGEIINSGNIDISVFVAPDESFALIEDTKDNSGPGLYISYKTKDGSWSKRIDLSLGWARFPSVSPDGKYLFFMTREGIFWVNTSFIETCRISEYRRKTSLSEANKTEMRRRPGRTETTDSRSSNLSNQRRIYFLRTTGVCPFGGDISTLKQVYPRAGTSA